MWKRLFGERPLEAEGSRGTSEGVVEAMGEELEAGSAGEVREVSPSIEINLRVRINDMSGVARAALALAMTSSKEEEDEVKALLEQHGWRAVATEVGGLLGEVGSKFSRSVIGAALNGRVIEKSHREMHALMHAAAEAVEGFMQSTALEASVGVKVAIVRNRRWISVAIVGDAAYHVSAHHERAGVGVMHI